MTVSGRKPKFFFMGMYVVRELPFKSSLPSEPQNVVTVLQIYFNVTLSPSAMQIHRTFVQLITVLISHCVMWMAANFSFMHLFPNGVRQLFKSKVRRTSYIALREQIAKLQTEVGCQRSL